MQESKSSFKETVGRGGAPPKVAAGYAAGLFYLWGEAVLRYLWTNTSLGNWYLYPQRTGDVAAIWLFSIVISLVGFVSVYVLFRKRASFGSIVLWSALVVASAIIAPMVGEIGTPFGI